MSSGDSVSKHATPMPVAYLSEQMSIRRIAEILEALRFDAHQEAKVVLDPGVRDYLLRASRAVAADPGVKIRHAWRSIRPPR